MSYFEEPLIARSREFIRSAAGTGSGSGRRVLVAYHGDGDGCTSAFFLSRFLKDPPLMYWVATPEFDFEKAEHFVLQNRPILALFLDMPVYNRLSMIQKLTDQGTKVFIYDHHYSGRSPIFGENTGDLLYINPLTTSKARAYPTCLFGWELLSEKSFFEKAVLYMGLYTETWLEQVDLFQEFTPPLQENLKEIARRIHASFLVEEAETIHPALNFLLKASDSPASLHALPYDSQEYRVLADRHALIQNEKIAAMKGVEAIIRKLHNPKFLISGIETKVRLCGLIASELRWRQPGLVVGIWQKWKDRLICELRRGMECRVNLALLVERVKSEIPLLTGGGHPEAAAFAAVESRFFSALRKLRDLLNQGFGE
jgi:single-stranded DNA-specific DHH superfamily exonuclease